VDGQPERTIVVETKPDGEREFCEQKPSGDYELLGAEPSTDGLTDVHVLSWKDVVSNGLEGGKHRCASEEDVLWLQDAFQDERPESAAAATWLEDSLNQGDEAFKYQSLATVYLAPSNGLIRDDQTRGGFEWLFEKSKEIQPKVDVSKVLAVDYVFCMLAQPGVSNDERLQWLVTKTPQYIKTTVLVYLQAHGVPTTVDGAALLVKQLAEEAALSKETKAIVSKEGGLLDLNIVRMQVFRVRDVTAGDHVVKFLEAARARFGLQSSFELLGDFKDLVNALTACLPRWDGLHSCAPLTCGRTSRRRWTARGLRASRGSAASTAPVRRGSRAIARCTCPSPPSSPVRGRSSKRSSAPRVATRTSTCGACVPLNAPLSLTAQHADAWSVFAQLVRRPEQ
jgi:hypothetical protein